MISYRCFAAATLELSQPDDEERKARALAAATSELERLFRKEDFRRMQVAILLTSLSPSQYLSTERSILSVFSFCSILASTEKDLSVWSV